MTILPSDDAFGIISFAPDSLSRVVSEGSGSTVYLTVRRTRGLLGPSNVYWQVSGPGAQDVENTDGFVLLSEFSNTTLIAIRIKEDAVCYLDNCLLSLSPYFPLSICPFVSVFVSVVATCLSIFLRTSAFCSSVDLSASLSFPFTLLPSLTFFIYWWINTPVFKKKSRFRISGKNRHSFLKECIIKITTLYFHVKAYLHLNFIFDRHTYEHQ